MVRLAYMLPHRHIHTHTHRYLPPSLPLQCRNADAEYERSSGSGSFFDSFTEDDNSKQRGLSKRLLRNIRFNSQDSNVSASSASDSRHRLFRVRDGWMGRWMDVCVCVSMCIREMV